MTVFDDIRNCLGNLRDLIVIRVIIIPHFDGNLRLVDRLFLKFGDHLRGRFESKLARVYCTFRFYRLIVVGLPLEERRLLRSFRLDIDFYAVCGNF